MLKKCQHAYEFKDKLDSKAKKQKRKLTALIDQYVLEEKSFSGIASLVS